MASYTDTGQRARLIAGLRGLAVFLEANPDAQAPHYTDVLVFPPDGSDAERRAEIDVIAARIGEAPETLRGHYVVWRFFGPVQYRAVAIPSDSDADGE
jgi:hypothetical protein